MCKIMLPIGLIIIKYLFQKEPITGIEVKMSDYEIADLAFNIVLTTFATITLILLIYNQSRLSLRLSVDVKFKQLDEKYLKLEVNLKNRRNTTFVFKSSECYLIYLDLPQIFQSLNQQRL